MENNIKNIRNFSIIAHVDHGKSTLADRFLELTHTLRKEDMQAQTLDMMDLERERGITIKMQPCTMEYELSGQKYQLNLIDTPGHMDFAYEVERSLAAVEGALLLVDVTNGVQAQTLANLRLARENNLTIIPVINKIDACPSPEQLDLVKKELMTLLEAEEKEILLISAKTGQGVEKILEEIVKRIPSPEQPQAKQGLSALVFDSLYDNYQGVIAFVRIFDGAIKQNSQIYLLNQQKQIQARNVGIFKPKRVGLNQLSAGQIGYIETGVKDVSQVRIGETIILAGDQETAKALHGYKEPKPLVFANLFAAEEQHFELLKTNLNKLRLTDTALSIEPINNPNMGRGLRVGFLGMLHLEIIMERLKREYQTEAIVTSPSVMLKVKPVGQKEPMLIYSPAEAPDGLQIDYFEEPWVKLNIITPSRFISRIHQLVDKKRGVFIDSQTLDSQTTLLFFQAPLAEIIEDFLDKLKSLTEGFASFSYQFDQYQKSDLVKINFMVSKEIKPSLAKIVHQSKAEQIARAFLLKLKENLPALNFTQSLQAFIGGKVIAREDISALRKDVTAKLYGGDVTRKRKLLDKQKKGKAALAEKGKTHIPQSVYLKLISR